MSRTAVQIITLKEAAAYAITLHDVAVVAHTSIVLIAWLQQMCDKTWFIKLIVVRIGKRLLGFFKLNHHLFVFNQHFAPVFVLVTQRVINNHFNRVCLFQAVFFFGLVLVVINEVIFEKRLRIVGLNLKFSIFCVCNFSFWLWFGWLHFNGICYIRILN